MEYYSIFNILFRSAKGCLDHILHYYKSRLYMNRIVIIWITWISVIGNGLLSINL
jgi:hypothetical protein